MSFRSLVAAGAVAFSALTIAACNHSAEKSTGGATAGDETKVAAAHTHEGWWCAEHGVPEEVCARCSTKLVSEFKEKGDWCEAHNRPESQCFICHPEKEAEFAALYEDKYGEKPPKPTEEADDADGEHEHHEKT